MPLAAAALNVAIEDATSIEFVQLHAGFSAPAVVCILKPAIPPQLVPLENSSSNCAVKPELMDGDDPSMASVDNPHIINSLSSLGVTLPG